MNGIEDNSKLHNGFWRFIEKYLPNYCSRDDILLDDILTRFIEDDDVEEQDMIWIAEEFNCDKNIVKKKLAQLETRFAQEALSMYYCSLQK